MGLMGKHRRYYYRASTLAKLLLDDETYQHSLRISRNTTFEVVAMLHDVVEDTDCTLVDLMQFGFGHSTIGAVKAITRNEDEPYFDYIKRLKSNHKARSVKLADLDDNMNGRESPPIPRLLQRYEKAYDMLVK